MAWITTALGFLKRHWKIALPVGVAVLAVAALLTWRACRSSGPDVTPELIKAAEERGKSVVHERKSAEKVKEATKEHEQVEQSHATIEKLSKEIKEIDRTEKEMRQQLGDGGLDKLEKFFEEQVQ